MRVHCWDENDENIQCGENFMDMECFMILNPSQQLAIAVLSLTLGTFTVLENLLVLCVILHSRSLRCRPSYHFIGSLAVADLLGSVIFVYSFVDFHVFHRKDSPNVFLFKLGGVTASFTASVGSLFLTAIDRYISIHRPLAYKRIVTRPKAVVAFCLMWTIAIVIAVLPLLGWNCKKLQSVCSDIFPLIDETYLMFWIGVTSVLLLFIVYAYMYILWKAHSHADGKVQVTRPDQARMDIRLAKTLVHDWLRILPITCWCCASSSIPAASAAGPLTTSSAAWQSPISWGASSSSIASSTSTCSTAKTAPTCFCSNWVGSRPRSQPQWAACSSRPSTGTYRFTGPWPIRGSSTA
uniref:Cannabinoid receptor 1 n=1 Tax=Bos mutus grunniens TaxID=30521 RepID=A0A8B9YQ11_BOSMU